MNSIVRGIALITLIAGFAGLSYLVISWIHAPSPPVAEQERTPSGAADWRAETGETGETVAESPVSSSSASDEMPAQERDRSPSDEQYARAVALLKAGRFREAAEVFDRIRGENDAALLGLGVAHYSLKQYDIARRYLEEYLEANEHALARKLLARMYYEVNDLHRARMHAEAGLGLGEDRELRALADRIRRDGEAQGSHVREASSHFAFSYDGYAQRDMGRKVAEILEDAYAQVGQAIGHFPSESIQVIMYTEREFHVVTGTPGWTGGIYDGTIRIPLKGAGDNMAALRRVLVHEYVHALVHSITDACPVWLNEGLAEFFSAGPGPRMKEEIPLPTLGGQFLSLPAAIVPLAYRQSHAAVTLLIEKYGMYRIKDLLVRLAGGDSFEDAFYSVYPVSLDEFRRQWAQES